MWAYLLMGLGVYVTLAYLDETELIYLPRWSFLLSRVVLSFAGAFVVGGLFGLWYGLGVLAISRLATRLDNYLIAVIVLSEQRRR